MLQARGTFPAPGKYLAATTVVYPMGLDRSDTSPRSHHCRHRGRQARGHSESYPTKPMPSAPLTPPTPSGALTPSRRTQLTPLSATAPTTPRPGPPPHLTCGGIDHADPLQHHHPHHAHPPGTPRRTPPQPPGRAINTHPAGTGMGHTTDHYKPRRHAPHAPHHQEPRELT